MFEEAKDRFHRGFALGVESLACRRFQPMLHRADHIRVLGGFGDRRQAFFQRLIVALAADRDDVNGSIP